MIVSQALNNCTYKYQYHRLQYN